MVLDSCFLELPYIPDFLLEDMRFYFVPSREDVRVVYHELTGDSAEHWASYYTKKGWSFIHGGDAGGEGPYRVEEGGIHLDILEPGRILAPRPRFRFEPEGAAYPIVSLEKRRPINPWKKTYIRALQFIKRYHWPHPVPRRVHAAVWEIEECGEVPGSTSWMNAEQVLLRSDSKEVRETLADVFYNRPEDFPLGSQVYLRVLGKLGRSGFRHLVELAQHPVTRKRLAVARTLGELRDPEGVDPLLELLEDEDPGVRAAALASLGNVGVPAGGEAEAKVRSYLESPEISERVWAAEALLQGGDEEQKKLLIQLVKEERRPLADMGELGQVLVEVDLIDAVPFLIQRLKDERREIALDAAEALERLTGLDIDFSAQQSAEQKRNAIRACSRWWDEKKRERSAQRQKK